MKKHIILVTNFNIFNTHCIDQSNFGSFGGGGKLGNSILGNPGKSGKSINCILGRRGNLGNDRFTFGLSGRKSLGIGGITIGLKLNSYSGIQIFNWTLILCKSR